MLFFEDIKNINTDIKNPKFKLKKWMNIAFSKMCSMWRKNRCIKEREANGLCSSLGYKTLIIKIPLVFRFKDTKLINKFSFTGDKFRSEMNLKLPRCTYIACEPFTNKKKE